MFTTFHNNYTLTEYWVIACNCFLYDPRAFEPHEASKSGTALKPPLNPNSKTCSFGEVSWKTSIALGEGRTTSSEAVCRKVWKAKSFCRHPSEAPGQTFHLWMHRLTDFVQEAADFKIAENAATRASGIAAEPCGNGGICGIDIPVNPYQSYHINVQFEYRS